MSNHPDALVRTHQHLIREVINTKWDWLVYLNDRPGDPYFGVTDDLESELNEKLFILAQKFDPSRGNDFRAFALKSMQNAAISYMRKRSKVVLRHAVRCRELNLSRGGKFHGQMVRFWKAGGIPIRGGTSKINKDRYILCEPSPVDIAVAEHQPLSPDDHPFEKRDPPIAAIGETRDGTTIVGVKNLSELTVEVWVRKHLGHAARWTKSKMIDFDDDDNEIQVTCYIVEAPDAIHRGAKELERINDVQVEINGNYMGVGELKIFLPESLHPVVNCLVESGNIPPRRGAWQLVEEITGIKANTANQAFHRAVSRAIWGVDHPSQVLKSQAAKKSAPKS